MTTSEKSRLEKFARSLGTSDIKARSRVDMYDSIHSYALRAYPEAVLCVLYGSVARGDEHNQSDLDVLLLINSFADAARNGEKKRVVIEGLPIEVYVLRTSLAISQLYAASETGHYLVACAISEGVFISGNPSLWTWLRAAARATLARDPPKPINDERMALLSRLSREIFKLRYARSPEAIYCAILILSTYQEFRLMEAGCRKGATSCMAKAFRELAEQDYLDLYGAFQMSSASGDWQGLAEETLKQMENFGGLTWETD